MSLTVTEAAAVGTVLRYTSGIAGPAGEPVSDDDLRLAVDTLVASAHKKLMAGPGPADAAALTKAIVDRLRPRAERPADEWDDDEGDDDAPMQLVRLTPIDGVLPVELITKFRGASQHIAREVRVDETVWFVGAAECDDVSLKRTKAGPKRHQVLLTTSLFELEERTGRRLINTLREKYRLGDDVAALPFKQVADEKLVEELGLGDSSKDPVVVIFDDETRATWPDDWKTPPGRPHAGERVVLPGKRASGDLGLVRQVLDFITGDVLEDWSQVDPDLAADIAAVEELQAGRRRHDTDDDLDGDPVDAGDEEG